MSEPVDLSPVDPPEPDPDVDPADDFAEQPPRLYREMTPDECWSDADIAAAAEVHDPDPGD